MVTQFDVTGAQVKGNTVSREVFFWGWKLETVLEEQLIAALKESYKDGTVAPCLYLYTDINYRKQAYLGAGPDMDFMRP
jgi:hypothetical protein